MNAIGTYHCGNNHGEPRIPPLVCSKSKQWGHGRTTRHTCHDPAGTTLAVSSKATDTKRHDCGETDRFEEKGQEKHGYWVTVSFPRGYAKCLDNWR